MGLTSQKSASHRGQHLQLQLAGLGGITVEPCLAAVVNKLRLDIGDDADDALATQGQQGDHLVIVAGVDVQLVAAEGRDLRHLTDIAGGFLDAVDERVLAQLLGRLGAMFRPVREGTLYRMTGMPPASAIAVKWATRPA